MKKIFFAAYSLDYGGVETALITLLNYLSKEDYDITLCLERKQGVFLDRLPENIKIITYKPATGKNPVIRKIKNFIRQQKFKRKYKNKFDFSASFATYSFPCSFVARCASPNSALWVHNDYMNFYNNDIIQYKKFFNDLGVDKFKKIVFVSDLDRRVFNAEFPQYSKKATTCHNLINYKEILEKADEKIDDFKKKDITTFINIGRHDEKQKRLSRIINATKRLNKEGYKFRVIFIGKGTDTQRYLSMSKNLKNIEFLGAKRNPYPYLKQSDALLLSSQFEGYPVVYVESYVLNKPIITTDVSDAKKDIEGRYGLVCDNSEKGVYEGMKEFLDKGFKPLEFDPEEFNKDIIDNVNKIINDK